MSFYRDLRESYERGASRVFALTGNINDLFCVDGEYRSLVEFICSKGQKNVFPVVYELNGPLRTSEGNKSKLQNIWVNWRTNGSSDVKLLKDESESFEQKWAESTGKPHYGLEFLRQLTIASRATKDSCILIIIEATDAVLPSSRDITSLNIADRRSITICRDWFSSPELLQGSDIIVMLSESINSVNDQIIRIPQVNEIKISLPDFEQRKSYLDYMKRPDSESIALLTSGLSLTAIRQVVIGRDKVESSHINKQVEIFMKKEVGDDVIEFKRPTHTLNDVIGNSQLKKYFREVLIPRFLSPDSISGAAVSGPIGGGKTFIFEAVAGELGFPVIVLKNLRNKYYGETDVISNRLERLLETMGKLMIFIDEADTQFGTLTDDSQDVEKRLTGKIQSMMSDTSLKGRIIWLLITARIERLSPDLRRQGRVGDLIIPVFDPSTKEDKMDFCRWALSPINMIDSTEKLISVVGDNYSAAAYSALRSELASRKPTDWRGVKEVLNDLISPDIAQEREYQKLQALLNCTRKSLLLLDAEVAQSLEKSDNVEQLRENWRKRLRELEV